MSDAGWCTSEPRTGLCSRCGKRFPGTTRHDTCCVIEMLYGRDFADLTRDMGMEKVLTAPRSPWQNPYVERLIGSIRRECLDHVIVLGRFRRVTRAGSSSMIHQLDQLLRGITTARRRLYCQG